MPVTIPESWPEWPRDGLEYLGHCPVCSSTERTVLYEDLIDRWFHAPGRWTMQLCSSCGSGYIDPRPNRVTVGLAYANYATHRPTELQSTTNTRLAARLRNGYLNTKYGYQMQPASRWGYLAMHLLPPPLRLEWDHYARHLPKPRPGHNKLLDVGCGNGEFLARARWQGWDVYGIDQDAVALSHARAAGIPVTHGPVETGLFPTNSFDVITSHQVIEHMHAPMNFMRALYAWLKPGGFVWLGTPNIASNLHREFGSDWYGLHPPQHLVVFSTQSFIKSMSSCGFKNIKLIQRGYFESHTYQTSLKMHNMSEVGEWRTFTDGTDTPPKASKKFRLELESWLHPETSGDLVAVGYKKLP